MKMNVLEILEAASLTVPETEANHQDSENL